MLAFGHCLGMCGGFALHLSQGKNGTRVLAGQLLWQAGKLSTYTSLGALAGYAGGFIDLAFLNHNRFQNLLSYATGIIILLMGLSLLGLLPVRRIKGGSAGEGALTALARRFFSASSPGAALIMGMATGLLPCPIVLSFLAFSLQSGSVAKGMATMGALSLGTMLPLLLFGGLSRLTRFHLRSWAPRAGGIILILLGLSTVLRGTEIFHGLFGCPSRTAPPRAQLMEQKPCCLEEIHVKGIGN